MAMKRLVSYITSRVKPREFLAVARVATEHDATKIVNVSVLVENVVSLSAAGGALGLYLKGKAQELSLEQRKVTAMELITEAYAKKAGIELKSKEEKKKGVNSLRRI